MSKTADAWGMVFALSGQVVTETIDAPRFRAAFKSLVIDPDLEWWPAPGAVLKRLPSRPVRQQLEQLPEVSDDQQRSNLDRLALVMQRIAGPKATNPGVQPNERQRRQAHDKEGQ